MARDYTVRRANNLRQIITEAKNFRENSADKIDDLIPKNSRKGHCKVDMLYFLLKSSASAFYEIKTRDYDFLGYAINSIILHFFFFTL